MAFPNRRTVNILLTILLFVVVLGIAYLARKVIVIFAFAILFAYLIDPVVRFLQRHSLFFKNLRGPHILEAYLAFVVLIALGPHVMAPGLFRQTGKLFKGLPALMDDLSTGEIATRLGSKYGWTDDQQYRLKSFLTQHRTDIQGLLAAAERITPTAVGSLVLIPILAIFLLSDGGKLANSLIQLICTSDNFEALQSLARELNVMLQHYIRAKVILGGLSFIYCSVTMLALGFPRAFGIGCPGGSPGIHTRGRLDAFSYNHHQRGRSHSLPLDLDGRASRRLANAYGLRDCPARYGTRTGNPPTAGNIHNDGWRRSRRDRWSLPIHTTSCYAARCLA